MNLESQLFSIMDVLVKAAASEISQLFSESSAALRLHLTQSLRENESLRMRVKLMRSELFSLKLQTRAARPSSRFALIRTSTPKPLTKAESNHAVSVAVNSEDQASSHVTDEGTNVASPDVILIKDEDESEGCSSVVGHDSHGTGAGVDTHEVSVKLDAAEKQIVDVQSRIGEPLMNDGDTIFNASELQAFSSMSTVSHDSHPTLPSGSSEPVRGMHSDIIGMTLKGQLERMPIIQTASTSMTALVNQKTGRDSEGGFSSPVNQLTKQQKADPTLSKSLYCNVCRQHFNNRSELNAHRASHTGESPVTCTMCGKLFVSKNTLGIHMRIHTGEKPYVCLLCGKRFTQNGGLRIHLRTHSGEKPYTCSVCHNSFNNPSNLRRHMITHNIA